MSHPYLDLSSANKTFYRALAAAVTAVCALDAAQSTVLDIDVRGGKPVLQIDRPPDFVRGAPTVSICVGDRIQRRMAAPWHGAQIEWTVHEFRCGLPARATS